MPSDADEADCARRTRGTVESFAGPLSGSSSDDAHGSVSRRHTDICVFSDGNQLRFFCFSSGYVHTGGLLLHMIVRGCEWDPLMNG